MTAEIAILNRYGVALAADSAVSVGRGEQPKVFNTVNKLFSLSKRAPVGTMVFGNALLSGVPWETVVKAFRQQLGQTVFETLPEYGRAFREYVESTPLLFTEEQEQSEFIAHCIELYGVIQFVGTQRLHEKFEEAGEATTEGVAEVLHDVIHEQADLAQNQDLLDDLPADHGETLVDRFRDSAEMVRAHVFEDLPFEDSTIEALLQLTVSFIDRPPPELGLGAGLVIAGFGESEFTPSLLEFEVYGVMNSKLRWRSKDPHRVTESYPALVVPFAQREMVDLFMSGIDPFLQDGLSNSLAALFSALPELIANALPNEPAEMRTSLQQGSDELLTTHLQYLEDEIRERHVRPILDAVASLPKEELAAMAEALVSLTSIKRRVTLDAETVGGPIDVAVISKGDGLIWIDRKHYFDPTLNHHFFANYFRYRTESQGDS